MNDKVNEILRAALSSDQPDLTKPTAVGWWWSRDLEFWNGPHDSREAALEDAEVEDAEDGVTVERLGWAGLHVEIDADAIWTRICEDNEEANFEGDAHVGPTNAELGLLGEALGRITRAWIVAVGARRHFRGVVPVKE